MDNQLTTATVSQALNTKWLGHPCQVLPEVDSTNDLLKERVHLETAAALPAGFMLLTEYQRQGRGRLARRWEAPPGSSLLFSLLFRPHWATAQANWLTMLVSLAATEAIAQHTDLIVGLKWPNDVMVQQEEGWHKVSGILQEGGFAEDGRLQWAIVGIGINVNIPAEQLPVDTTTPATSLLAAGGKLVSRLPLLASFLNRLEALYDLAQNGRSPHPDWQDKLITLGQTVQVTHTQTSHSVCGIAEATNEAGHLLVRDEAGQRHTVAAADVTLRPE